MHLHSECSRCTKILVIQSQLRLRLRLAWDDITTMRSSDQQHGLNAMSRARDVSVMMTSSRTSCAGQQTVLLQPIHQCHVDRDLSATSRRRQDSRTSASEIQSCRFLTDSHTHTHKQTHTHKHTHTHTILTAIFQ